VSESILIAPSILAADFTCLGDEIRSVTEAGADWIHIDVMDGHFVPNITIGPGVVASLRKCTDLPFDCHLMIENPEQYIPAFADAGSNMISVHVETSVHLNRSLDLIREHGAKPGVVINPATPLQGLRYVVEELDYILLMSVNPGFGGQQFIPSTLKKLRDLRALLEDLGSDAMVQIDGGIGPLNAGEVIDAGARILVAGSAIFHHPPYEDVINRLRNSGS